MTVEPIALGDRRIQRLVFEEARTVAGRARCRESGVERAQRLAWIAALDDAHASGRRASRAMRDWRGCCASTSSTGAGSSWTSCDRLRRALPPRPRASSRRASTPQQVAAAAGVPVTTRRLLLVDAPRGAARDARWRGRGRRCRGPWEDGDEHVVARVRERTLPDAGDQAAVARARRRAAGGGRRAGFVPGRCAGMSELEFAAWAEPTAVVRALPFMARLPSAVRNLVLAGFEERNYRFGETVLAPGGRRIRGRRRGSGAGGDQRTRWDRGLARCPRPGRDER